MDLIGRLEQCENITEVEVRPFFIYLKFVCLFVLKSGKKEWSEGETGTGEKKKGKN